MEIPYIVDERPDTGLTNVKLGIWLFLASEVMLFGGLFSAYILLRINAVDGAWPAFATNPLSVPIGAFNTVVLISSSVTMVLSYAALKMDDLSGYKKYMGLTIGLSLLFLVVKSYEYYDKFSHGDIPAASTFLAVYFTMTGLHGLHIIGGVVVNGYFLGPGTAMWYSNKPQFINRIEASGLYWHFVDLVWIFLFPVLYLL
jgi:cytochrome c oxidase subunit 3